MAKRISRRELKQKIRDLDYELKCKSYDLDTVTMKYNELRKRFTDLGSKAETFEIRGCGLECIEVKPIPFGQYYRGNILQDMGWIKERLVSDIAKGLLDSNMVQIITKDEEISTGWSTVAAKLYVIPWDKLVKVLKTS